MADSSVNWGSVADWVSGLGSMSAGIVALYLARAASRIRLRGYCGIRTVIEMGDTPPHDVLMISVTNVGTRATIINNISIRVGFLKKRYGVITLLRDRYSVEVPFPLGDGQEGHWGIPLDNDEAWLKGLCKSLVKTPRDVRTLRFCIHTNHGEVLRLRPEEQLQQAVLRHVSRKDA